VVEGMGQVLQAELYSMVAPPCASDFGITLQSFLAACLPQPTDPAHLPTCLPSRTCCAAR
jgi:hypothetical protein